MKDMKVAKALEMALALSKNYTWDAYNALIDYCEANEIFFFHDEEEAKIYIEDDWFSIA